MDGQEVVGRLNARSAAGGEQPTRSSTGAAGARPIARRAGRKHAAAAAPSRSTGHGQERWPVVSADPEQQAGHGRGPGKVRPGGRWRRRRDDRMPCPTTSRSDVAAAARRAPADADVLRVLLDVVRHHAVDADDRQQQRDRREPADEHRQRARLLERPRRRDRRWSRRREKGSVGSRSRTICRTAAHSEPDPTLVRTTR